MATIAELVERTERLTEQLDVMRRELGELRNELIGMSNAQKSGEQTDSSDKCIFAVGLSLAQDLGPEFSSERPHDLAGRGDDWFE